MGHSCSRYWLKLIVVRNVKTFRCVELHALLKWALNQEDYSWM